MWSFQYSSQQQEKHGPSEFDDVLGDEDEGCDVGQFGKRRHSISKAQSTRRDHYESDVPTVPLFVEMQGPGKFVKLGKHDVLWIKWWKKERYNVGTDGETKKDSKGIVRVEITPPPPPKKRGKNMKKREDR